MLAAALLGSYSRPRRARSSSWRPAACSSTSLTRRSRAPARNGGGRLLEHRPVEELAGGVAGL